MNLFADYLQPLTAWLQANPHWSLFITFFISLAESLAIIGSIVPGSVTMTAIGILAGSGIMRIDLTLLAATVGAICGDSLSYALGYWYSEQLVDIWPFRKYPAWLKYGKEFFARHGGKSVLIGRFIGPLRSIIPLIAGILHMKQWRFLIANVISAIGWSMLYIMPGILIGAASHELSSESASRLFALILTVLIGLWLISYLIKWIAKKLHSFLKNNAHHFWLKLKHNTLFSKLYNALTPKEEHNHNPTAELVLLTLFCFLGFMLLSIQLQWINSINLPTHFFIQSLHSSLLESIVIICTQFTSTLTLICMYILCCLWFIYNRNLRALFYISSLMCSSIISAFILSHCITSPRPQGFMVIQSGNSFPAINLLVATAFYGFILFYLNNKYSLLTNSFRTFIVLLLGFSGFGALYLGDYWLTDILGSYFIGTTLCFVHYLIYRRIAPFCSKKERGTLMISSLFTCIICSSALSIYFNFQTLAHDHTPSHREYRLDKSKWWNQQEPILPLYRLNRTGKKISLLNIQYSGDLTTLQNSLVLQGWEVHTETFFTKLLMRMNNDLKEIKLPLLTQLYENKSPDLIMTYKDANSKKILELTIWESNYILTELKHPIWIGTIYENNSQNRKPLDNHSPSANQRNTLTYLLPALNQFTIRRVKLSPDKSTNTYISGTPYILLIKSSTETY